MNKLFIVLLIAAIGAGAFFYLRNNNSTATNDIKKEWLIGQWKIDTVTTTNDPATSFMVGIMGLVDSNSKKYHYQFTNEGTVLRLISDSVTKDTSRYEWIKEQLLWREDATDTIGTKFSVLALNKDSLLIRDADSIQVLFKKVK